MAFDNLSHNVPPQKFSELSESSRCGPRQKPLREGQTTSIQGNKSPEETQENMQRSLENQENAAIIGGKTVQVEDEVEMRSAGHKEANLPNLLEGEAGNAKTTYRTWLSSALLTKREQEIEEVDQDQVSFAPEKWCPNCSASHSESCSCGVPMQAVNSTTVLFPSQVTYAHWLSMPEEQTQPPQHQAGKVIEDLDSEYDIGHQTNRMATELNLSPAGIGRDGPKNSEMRHSTAGPNFAEDYSRSEEQSAWERARQQSAWEHARNDALVAGHPLFPVMLEAHASCLRVGTPVDDLPYIEARLSQAQSVINKFRVLQPDQLIDITQEEKHELDHFMNGYTMYLASFKDTLEDHVSTEINETMVWMWNMDRTLHTLTGNSAAAGLGSGATMSDEGEYDSDNGRCADRPSLDPQCSGAFGPLAPTESERTLMERVRHQLKYELKQGYRKKIVDVREEIMRKRRAGKLPEGTTTVLKAWWQDHHKWPYPTEDEKEQLIQDTGLELKQVNNWFINQRKRNWNANPLLSTSSEFKAKIKRKSW